MPYYIDRITHGNNLDIIRLFPDECIDLVYCDPPFFTNRDFGDFDDRFDSMDSYLEFMEPRLHEFRRVLKPTGTMLMHLDYRASHYVKVLMDEVFGYKRFRDEIIWDYGVGRVARQKLGLAHNTIFVYSKNNKRTYNVDDIREPYADATLKRSDKKCDPRGKLPVDVWKINSLGSGAKERVGYETQKPVRLLDRLIRMSTNEGDIVLDPFCGSGTTCVAAQNLNRRFVGIDKNRRAVKLGRERCGIR